MKSAAKLAKEYTFVSPEGRNDFKAVLSINTQIFTFAKCDTKKHAQWFCNMMGKALHKLVESEKEQEIAPVRKPRVKKTDDEWKMIPVEVRSKPRVFGMNALIIQAKKQSKTWKFNDRRTN
jgi:hypothetical protein